jgi:hypothetical protein
MAVSLSVLLAGRSFRPEISSGTHCCLRRCEPQGLVQLEGLGILSKFNDPFGNRARDLPACSLATQTSTLPVGLVCGVSEML